MTEEQAIEILEFIQNELHQNNFFEIDEEILIRWYELEDENLKTSKQYFLKFYLNQIINIFNSYSNTNVIEKSISKINGLLEDENRLEDISLEYFDGTERKEFDLKKLPGYQEEIKKFETILSELFPQ